MYKAISIIAVLMVFFAPALLGAVEIYKQNDISLDVSFWGQVWYQFVEDGKDADADGIGEEDLNDFLFRRAYLGIKGQITADYGFFVHIASDRVGQEGLDNSGHGLGTGVAIRDAWVTAMLFGNDLIFQAGRMYVPFTRNYGTSSTKSLLTTDLDWTQGGLRGSIFYPSKVGRDDGITLWGNVIDERLQYRFMVGEGVEGNPANPDDSLRFAGRLSISILGPETGWFNQENNLGTKNVLSIGMGFDTQDDLVIKEAKRDYIAWTGDIFYDRGRTTVSAAYINVENGPNPINYTRMRSGDDMAILSLKAGYLFPVKVLSGSVQPFVHYEHVNVDNRQDTNIYGLGINHIISGNANKISLDLTFVDQERENSGDETVQDHLVLTLQFAAGF